MQIKDNYKFRLLNILNNNINLIIDNPYVVGMGYGLKIINGKTTDIPSLTFITLKKLPNTYIYPQYRIPKYINGVLTDVIEDNNQQLCGPTTRPVSGGDSISNSEDTQKFGTIAYPVTDYYQKKLYILSSAHVLTCPICEAKKNYNIISPAIKKGGKNPTDIIGTISKLSPIRSTTDRKEIATNPYLTQSIDAGLVNVGENTNENKTKLIVPYVRNKERLVNITNTVKVNVGDSFWASTSTSPTPITGTVDLISTNRIFEETTNMITKYTFFKDLIRVKDLSRPFVSGDSGALGIKTTNKPNDNPAFGMLMTSDNSKVAYFCSISNVFKEFQVDFAYLPFLPTPNPSPSSSNTKYFMEQFIRK